MIEWLKQVTEKESRLIVGLMSGTSLDGIDAALVRVTGTGLRSKAELIHFESYPFEDRIRERLKELCTIDRSDVATVCSVNFELGHRFAEAVLETVRRAGRSMEEVDLISSHGQTVWHIPEKLEERPEDVRSTLQIGDLSVIAKETGKPVVGDYRTADMAVGGQGAPLTPYADVILFQDERIGRVVQNIGGIGNCAAIPAGGRPEQVIAFDTGPGNMLIDQAVYVLSEGAATYDANGDWAARGTVDSGTLSEMMAHPYFSMKPVKTTGREMFGKPYAAEWLARMKERGLAPEDIVATFTAFTAETIARGYKDFVLPQYPIGEVIISGGGAHNRTLLSMLGERLPGIKVLTSDGLGVSSDAKEAVAFALFGNNFLFGEPNNLPAATGAASPTVMGKLAMP